jgi:hypothetical protein
MGLGFELKNTWTPEGRIECVLAGKGGCSINATGVPGKIST